MIVKYAQSSYDNVSKLFMILVHVRKHIRRIDLLVFFNPRRYKYESGGLNFIF